MILKRLLYLILGFLTLAGIAFAGVFWALATDGGLNVVLDLLGKSIDSLPVKIQFNNVEGSLINGFTLHGLSVASGDKKLVDAEKLFLRFSLSKIEEKRVVPEKIEIEGAQADFDGLLTAIDYLSSLGGGGKPEPVDFKLTSSDLRKIPGTDDLQISELSLGADGALKVRVMLSGVPIQADTVIASADYEQLQEKNIPLKIGAKGSARLSASFKGTPRVETTFHNIDTETLLAFFKTTLPIDGVAGGKVAATFGSGGTEASGDLRIEGLRVAGVPVSSFRSPFYFSANKALLNLTNIRGAMRGMESLRGNAVVSTRDGSGELKLSGEKLSLSALQPVFKLNFPVAGENGSFRSEIKFTRAGISGNAALKLPSLVVEKQKIDALTLNLAFKDDKMNVDFSARALGAPISGSGTVEMKSGLHSNLNAKLTNVNISALAPFVPELSGAKGIISAEINLRGSLTSPQISGTAKSDKLTVQGVELQKLALSMSDDGNFKLSSGGTMPVNASGKINFAAKTLDMTAKLSGISLKKIGINENAAGDFKITGSFSDPKFAGTLNAAGLDLKLSGNMSAVNFELKEKSFAGGTVSGRGKILPKNLGLDVDLDIVNVAVRPLLALHKMDFGLGGIYTGKIKIAGTVAAPKLTLTAKYPLTFKETLLDNIALTLSPVNDGVWQVGAKMRIAQAMDITFDGKANLKKDNWSFDFSSNRVSMDELIKVRFPSLVGKIDGRALVRAQLDSKRTLLTFETAHLRAFGFPIRGLRMPVEYSPGALKFTIERGNVGGALIYGGGTVDLKKNTWKANFSVKDIFLEKLMEPVLEPRGGKLTGRANLKLAVSGNIGILTNIFGGGEFEAWSGALQGLSGLEKLNSERKIEFANASGKFFFDGKDVTVAPGGVVNAKAGDKFYRHVRFSGPLGITGRGMNLRCSARIDARAFNLVIGALGGVISYATGANGLQNPVRAVVQNFLGLKLNTFSDITFNVRGGWGDPILSDVKLEKQMQGVYQIGKEEKAVDDRKEIEIHITVPIGPGGSKGEGEDALKQGIIDSLFDNLAPKF